MRARLIARRLWLPALVGAVIGGILTTGAALAQTVVTVWSWRVEDVPAYEKMFAAFEKKNPDIDVRFVTYQDSQYETILTTALKAKKGPDIAQLKPYGELQPLVEAKLLLPLDDRVPELKNFYPVALEGARGRSDGKLYGVPYSVPNMGIFYNKAIFKKYDLSVPKTWDEFMKSLQTLKGNGVIPIAAGGASGSGWSLEIMIGVFGPNIYGGNSFWDEIRSGKADFNDARFVAVLKRLQELGPYLTPGFEGIDYTSATFQFINEQAAMFVGGSWENGNFKIQNPKLDFGIFAAPPSKAGDPAITSSFCDGSYGLTSSSKNPEAATKVLRFMASKEFAQMFADELGWPPATAGVSSKDPVLQQMLAMQECSTPYLTLVGFRWQTPTASEVIQSKIASMIAGRISPEQLAADVQAAVKTWYKPFQK